MIPFFLITLSHLLLRCTSHSFFLALQPTICILAQAYVCFVRVFSSISELIKLIWSKVNGTRRPKVSVHLLLHIHLVLLDEIIFVPLNFDHISFMSSLIHENTINAGKQTHFMTGLGPRNKATPSLEEGYFIQTGHSQDTLTTRRDWAQGAAVH